MRFIVLILLLMTLTHTISATEKTTGNLITNGNFETGNANGWTTTGNVDVLNDCCELNNVTSNYDLEFGNSGSITQDFNLTSDTILQTMLDNGITLNSTVEVQNGECGVSGCWGGQGAADTFTITLNIKDSNGNLLATNTTIRTDVTGINGANFTDTLIYSGINSNIGNIHISGTDANAPATLGGANLDNISVTMTYDDTVLTEQASTALTNIEEVLEELTTEVFNEIEELYLKEEIKFAEEIIEVVEMEALPTTVEVMAKEIVEEIIEEIEEKIEPPTTMMASLPKEKMVETVEEKAEEIIEEIYEETVSMVSEKEETVKEEKEVIEESAVEEENKETVEETNVPEKEQAEKKSEVKTEEEEESNSEESTTEVVSTTNNTKQKNIRQKKNINVDKVMAKVDEAIKDIDKNLQVKNIIKLEIMTNDQASLTGYATIPFYKSKDIYLNQLNMSDPRLLYTEVTLNKYKVNDPVFKKQELLHNIKLKKQKLLIELEQLKNG